MSDEVTKADVQKARQALSKVSELETKITKAKACGIECDELDERCQHAKQFLIHFNEIFGPEFPARSK